MALPIGPFQHELDPVVDEEEEPTESTGNFDKIPKDSHDSTSKVRSLSSWKNETEENRSYQNNKTTRETRNPESRQP